MFSQVWALLTIKRLLLYLLTVTVLSTKNSFTNAKAIDLFDAGQLIEHLPNYCNSSELIEGAGLIKSTLGQFLGFECSAEFFHCRWQSDGYRTYKKLCRPGEAIINFVNNGIFFYFLFPHFAIFKSLYCLVYPEKYRLTKTFSWEYYNLKKTEKKKFWKRMSTIFRRSGEISKKSKSEA